jgi:LMBR1 domain-containing protein 1
MVLFVLFGGVGLSALPLDLINEFLGRPKIIKSQDASEKKRMLKKKAVELIELGTKIKDEQGEVKHVDGFWAKRK